MKQLSFFFLIVWILMNAPFCKGISQNDFLAYKLESDRWALYYAG
jgi:hypothetical protein